MRFAVISDIHGNLPAFEAVVEDLRKQDPDGVVCLGDVSFNGLYPQESFDLLMSLYPFCAVKGNTDANFEELSDFVPMNDFERSLYDMIVYGAVRLSAGAKSAMKSWPIAVEREIEGRKLLFCHGSPWRFKDHFSPKNPDFPELFEEQTKALGVNAIFCGHTHRRETFQIGDTLVVNVGAIGYSFDGDPRPSYGMVDVEHGEISCDLRRVAYDFGRYREEILESKLFGSLDYIIAYATYPPRG